MRSVFRQVPSIAGMWAAIWLLGPGVPVVRAQGPATTAESAAETSGAGEPAPAPRDRGVQLVWRDHPSVRSGRAFRADFELKFQGDGRYAGERPASFDAFEVRRLRAGVQGEITRRIDFSVERELTTTDFRTDTTARRKTPWKDVWVEWNATRQVQIRAGRFKIPFGLDQLTGISQNDFVYRSLGATYLAPARDTGAVVRGRLRDRRVEYTAGLFVHDGDNARSSTMRGADRTFAARVTTAPLRLIGRRRPALELGAAVAISRVGDASHLPNGLRGRTLVSEHLFFAPVFVNGRRQRMEVDLDWQDGPFGVRAEYTTVLDERLGQSLASRDLPPARARAWYVAGAWVLTGQPKRRPMTSAVTRPGMRPVGAIEAVARLERLWFDSQSAAPPSRSPRADAILPNGEYAFTLGANWYPGRFAKFQLGVIAERITNAERSPVNGGLIWSPVMRIQVAL